MQLQTKPRLYSDVNKHMNESYYNYEAYEIEYGYLPIHAVTSTSFKSSPRLEKASIPKSTPASPLEMIRPSSSRHSNLSRRVRSSERSRF